MAFGVGGITARSRTAGINVFYHAKTFYCWPDTGCHKRLVPTISRHLLVSLQRLAVLCVLFGLVNSALAHTAVWQITKDNNTIYLGGTIHVLSADDYPLPLAFQQAYSKSSIIYFEVDLDELDSASFLKSLSRKSAYPLGESLRDKLTEETWLRLDEFLLSRGLSANSVNHLRPGAIMSTLLALELTSLGVNAEGVDHYYHQQSTADEKEIRAFETAEQQVQLIANLGVGEEEEFIRYLIEDLDSLNETFEQMKDAWLHGDNSLLARISRLEELKTEDPLTYAALLEKRNAAWLPEIEQMLDTEAVELVLVGALHLAGEDGLLKSLTDRGYQITQMQSH